MNKKISRKQFFDHAFVLSTMGFGLTAIAGCDDDDDFIDGLDGGVGGQGGTGGADAGGAGGSVGDAGGAGGSAGSGGTGGTAPVDSCDSVVEEVLSHVHELTVPPEDVAAGTEKTYTLSFVLDHEHEVTLSADDFATLATGAAVVVTSTVENAHDHDVTVTCS